MSMLASPMVLFFALGAFAASVRSDLSVPEAVGKALALYLMAAIGLKGGVEVAAAGFSLDMGLAAVAGVALSFMLPLPAFWLLQRFGRLPAIDAGAVAAHYGSVSVVTFVAGVEALRIAGTPPAGYMAAVLALMETPAILMGLWLARGRGGATGHAQGELLRETVCNGPVLLLLGSFLIGCIIGKDGFVAVAPVFEAGFRGMLCLFLLDMGLLAVRRLMQARGLTWRLASLAIIMPAAQGLVGVALGTLIGLQPGTAAALGILAASASYIAVPAAMRLALPQADAGISLGMSLGITFPFNILVGIPLYLAFANWMAAA